MHSAILLVHPALFENSNSAPPCFFFKLAPVMHFLLRLKLCFFHFPEKMLVLKVAVLTFGVDLFTYAEHLSLGVFNHFCSLSSMRSFCFW